MSADYMSKAQADRQFEQGDDLAECHLCPRVETFAGQFRTCRSCGEPFCPSCGYEDITDLDGQCADRIINQIAAREFNQ